MTKIDLYDGVKRLIQRPNLSSDDFSLLITMTEGILNRELVDHPKNRTNTVLTITNNYADLPSDLLQIYNVADSNGELTQESPKYPNYITRGWADFGTKIYIYGNEGDVTLDYYKTLDSINTVDSNWILESFGDVYLFGIISESRILVRDDARLGVYTALFKERLASLALQGWNQNFGAATAIATI